MKNEEEILKDRMEKWLSKYFHVEREVTSVCKTARIDLMLIHKSDEKREFPLGIEVKLEGKKKGAELGDWVLQLMRYKQCVFTGYEKPIPFIYPQISGLYWEEGKEMAQHEIFLSGGSNTHHAANGFLGAMGMGELQKFEDSRYPHKNGSVWHYRFSYSNNIIWDSRLDQLDIEKIVRFTHHKLRKTPKVA